MTTATSPLLANVLRTRHSSTPEHPTPQDEALNTLLARTTDQTARMHAAVNTRNTQLLKQLAMDPHDSVRWAVLDNPATTQDIIITVAGHGGTPAQAAALHPHLREPNALTALKFARSGLRANGLRNIDHAHVNTLASKPELATALAQLMPYPALPSIVSVALHSAGAPLQNAIAARVRGHHPPRNPRYDFDPEQKRSLPAQASAYLIAAAQAARLDSTTRPANGNQGDPALQWWARPTSLPPTSSYYLMLTALIVSPYAHGTHLQALRTSNLGPYQPILTARLLANPTTSPADRLAWLAATPHTRPHSHTNVNSALLDLADDPDSTDIDAATAIDLAISNGTNSLPDHKSYRRAESIVTKRPAAVAILARSGNRNAARAAVSAPSCSIDAVIDTPARIALAEYHNGPALAAWLLDELGSEAFNTMLGIELEFDGTLRELMHAARSLTN